MKPFIAITVITIHTIDTITHIQYIDIHGILVTIIHGILVQYGTNLFTIFI